MSLVHGSRQEIPSLDGWRALAVGIVVLSHIGLGRVVPGGLGVTIFFFLSGYLITRLLCSEFEKRGTISIRSFYLRRLFRLTPPLLLTLVLAYSLTSLGLLSGHASWSGFFAQLFYFANYFALFFNGDNYVPYGTGVFWSLAVEEHFYFVFPFLFLLTLRKAGRQHLLFLLAFLCALVLLWRCYLVIRLNVPIDRTYFASDTRVDSILFGCILAICPISSCWKEKINQDGTRFVGVAFGVFLLLATLVFRSEVFRETVRYTLQGIALIPLFYYSVEHSNALPFRILNYQWVKKIGVYSYSIYLSHHILWTNVAGVFENIFLRVACTLIATWLFAAFVEIFVDRPLRGVRAQFR